MASPGSLAITCLPSVKRGPVAPELWVSGTDGASLDGRSWSLPGLDVEVAATPESVEVDAGGVARVRFPVGTEDLSLRLSAT